MGWIGFVGCGKFRRDFGARTFVPVRPVLHRVSKVNQTVPNAPKLYEMHQNMSLGSNAVERVRSLRKIPTPLRGTNFCTISARFAPSFVSQLNGPKCTKFYQMHQNICLGSNGVDRVRLLRKIPTTLRGTNFCTILARFHRVL